MPDAAASLAETHELAPGWTAMRTREQTVPGDSHLLEGLNAYWWSIKPAEGLPGRQHFDPLDVPELLPWLYLLDAVPQADGTRRFRFRLIGTGVVHVFEREYSRRWLDEVYDAKAAAEVAAGLEVVIAAACPVAGDLRIPLSEGGMLRFKRLICPLAGDGVNVDMLVGIQAHAPKPV
jgi:hypothetical protein